MNALRGGFNRCGTTRAPSGSVAWSIALKRSPGTRALCWTEPRNRRNFKSGHYRRPSARERRHMPGLNLIPHPLTGTPFIPTGLYRYSHHPNYFGGAT